MLKPNEDVKASLVGMLDRSRETIEEESVSMTCDEDEFTWADAATELSVRLLSGDGCLVKADIEVVIATELDKDSSNLVEEVVRTAPDEDGGIAVATTPEDLSKPVLPELTEDDITEEELVTKVFILEEVPIVTFDPDWLKLGAKTAEDVTIMELDFSWLEKVGKEVAISDDLPTMLPDVVELEDENAVLLLTMPVNKATTVLVGDMVSATETVRDNSVEVPLVVEELEVPSISATDCKCMLGEALATWDSPTTTMDGDEVIRGLSTADEVAGKSTDCFELVNVSNVEEEMAREVEE